MDIKQKLNPFNSLFGRMFLWFWFAVSVMVVVTFIVARYAGGTWELSEPSARQVERITETQVSIQRLLDRNQDINRVLRRGATRGRWYLMAIDESKLQLELGFPLPFLSQESKFLTLVDAPNPILIRTNNMEFIGPALVTSSKNESYQLFIGQMLPRDEQPFFVIGSALVVFLLLGTLACIGISYAIVKPIKRLGQLSNAFAAGHHVDPDTALESRRDELGQLHQDIYQMATNLARSLTQQKALMANISHELRTPLTRMQLAVAMLEPSDTNSVTYAQRIEKEIGVMDTLIGQALQLAKIGSLNQQVLAQTQRLSLCDVLNPILEDLAFEAKASNKQFNCNECPELEMLLNPTSFSSAIENVTRNAIKFSHNLVQVSATFNKNANTLELDIEDDGIGLSQEQMVQIFEPFYRAPSGKSEQGTGLGLAIAKAGVELHKGRIQVSNSSLGGLKIHLSFPVTLS